MWSVEKDPWFASTIGTILVCEGSIDADLFCLRMAGAVAALPRLRERVLPRLGRLVLLGVGGAHFPSSSSTTTCGGTLPWPPPGDRRQLLELATRLLQDPFDRTPPLWQFWIVSDLGRGCRPPTSPATCRRREAREAEV